MGYRKLADAIVLQAVEDYRCAIGVLSTKDMNEKMVYAAQNMKCDCENFFRSQFYEELTSISPDAIMQEVKDGVRNAIIPIYDNEKRQYFCICKNLIHKSTIKGKAPVIRCKFCGRYIRVHGEPLNTDA